MSDPTPPPRDPPDAKEIKRLREAYGMDDPPTVGVGAFATAGIELAAVVAGLTLLGWWLDGRWHTSPLFVLVGAFLGIGGGMYRLIRTLTRASGPR